MIAAKIIAVTVREMLSSLARELKSKGQGLIDCISF